MILDTDHGPHDTDRCAVCTLALHGLDETPPGAPSLANMRPNGGLTDLGLCDLAHFRSTGRSLLAWWS